MHRFAFYLVAALIWSASVMAAPVIATATIEIRGGDTVDGLLLRNNIRPNPDARAAVLELNPALDGFDRLQSGQTITLPAVEGESLVRLPGRQESQELDEARRELLHVSAARGNLELANRIGALDTQLARLASPASSVPRTRLREFVDATEFLHTRLIASAPDNADGTAEALAQIDQLTSGARVVAEAAEYGRSTRRNINIQTIDTQAQSVRNYLSVFWVEEYFWSKANSAAEDERYIHEFSTVSSPAKASLPWPTSVMIWAEWDADGQRVRSPAKRVSTETLSDEQYVDLVIR